MIRRLLGALFFGTLVWCELAAVSSAQTRTVATLAAEIIDFYRPQVAAAPDGSTAVAWEALRQGQFVTEWIIAVQRFSPDGTPVGPLHYLEPESGCLPFDTWLGDAQSNIELAFAPSGVLLVLMQHSGEFSAGGDGRASAEATLGLIGADGSLVDLSSSDICRQWKFIFPGADRQDRPRMALTPAGELLLTMDGFFSGSDLRNVGLAGFSGDLQELFVAVPHDDPLSTQAFHMWPDVATNGSVIASVWHECPIVDPQGNADECDIGAQFLQVQQDGSLAALGPNQRVNTADPSGTLNWRPSVAMAPGGNSVVAWQDYRNGVMGDVYAQLFNGSGQPVGQNIRVSEGAGFMEARPEVRPEVAILDDGRFMIVWADSSAAGFLARGRTFGAAGQPDGPPVVLSEGFGVQSALPAVSSSGTAFYYAFISSSAGQLKVEASIPGTGTAREEESALAETFAMEVFPNPFSSGASIHVEAVGNRAVEIVLYDLLGRAVETLHQGVIDSGTMHLRIDGSRLSPGAYFLRLRSDRSTITRALMKVE